MDNNELFQYIFDNLFDLLPLKWDELIFYTEYGNSSYSMEFYVKEEGKGFVKCFEIPEINRKLLLARFMNIDKKIKVIRKDLKKNECWTNLTMSVMKSGKMKTDFDYTNLTVDSYIYKETWKKKYLEK